MIQYAEEARDLTPADIALMHATETLSKNGGLGVGLTGAHRTGKTTIVDQLAAKNPFPVVRSSATALAQEIGFDVNADNSLAERLVFQHFVLSRFEEDYAAQAGLFFADRTPLDMAAYMLADVRGGDIDPEMDAAIKAYVERCVQVTNRYFAVVIAIQPGIPYVTGEGKPAPNLAYQEKVSNLMIGLAATRLTCTFRIIGRGVTDLQRRANAVAEMVTGHLSGLYSTLRILPRQ